MININGRSFNGGSVTIVNNVVYIDDNKVDGTDNEKIINITVNGNLDVLDVDTCNEITIVGDCGDINNKNGNLHVEGNVSGDVTNKNGNIRCSNVGGNVDSKNGIITHNKLVL